MLKGIPNNLSPDLLKLLMEMGHGDSVVFADANFPAASCARRLVRADGHAIPSLLESVLQLFPLDTFTEQPAGVMEIVSGDPTVPAIWDEYRALLKSDPAFPGEFEMIPRFSFYERSKAAFGVIATGETALYANLILTKGIIG